jgi:uncharacterized protein (DUF927 family)
MDTQSERLIFQAAHPIEHAFKARGTLDDWRENQGKVCVGNSRLVFSVSTGFAAPLVYPTGEESGGVHFYGISSEGKTTLLRVAGSEWGGSDTPYDYLVPWRATSNGLEPVAAHHCDSLLCLDEINQVSTREAGESAYMLANGSGKQRARRDGSGKPVVTWRILFLSSGEISLADKIQEDGRGRVLGGQQVRVVDIPADAGQGLGVFEDLHGHANGQAFADYLKAASNLYYGTAARAFIREVACDFDAVADAAKKARDEFVSDYCPLHADGQVKRVAARFGLIGAAGELATAFNILPWPEGEAERAARVCFDAWLEHRGGTGPAEIAAGIEQVRRFFQLHGESRFRQWEGDDLIHPIAHRAGIKRRADIGSPWEFYVFPEVYTTEICAGFDARHLTKELIKRGFMIPGKDRAAGLEYVPGFGGKPTRLYHFTSAILGDQQ